MTLWGGGFSEAFGAMLAPRATKTLLKCSSNFHRFRHRFLINLGSMLDWFLEGFGSHVGSQEALKINLKFDWIFNRFFVRFLLIFEAPKP